MHLDERRLAALVVLAVVGTLGVYVIDSLGLYGVNVNMDIVAHFSGGIAVGAGFYVGFHRLLDLERMYSDLASIAAVIVAAFAVEVFEIYSPSHAGFFALGVQDTQGDILAVVAGGLLALMVGRYYKSANTGHTHDHTHGEA